ncbi:MAG: archease [Candidatus Micrarchaeia archaeon]
MRRYKFIDHTADIEFVAFGTTPRLLFKNALLALFDTTAYIDRLSRKRGKVYKIKVIAKEKDMESLLWDILQSTFSKCDAKGLFGYNAESLSIKKHDNWYEAVALLNAKKKCPECARLDVKGISKYEMRLETSKRGGKNIISAYVVVDV